MVHPKAIVTSLQAVSRAFQGRLQLFTFASDWLKMNAWLTPLRYENRESSSLSCAFSGSFRQDIGQISTC